MGPNPEAGGNVVNGTLHPFMDIHQKCDIFTGLHRDNKGATFYVLQKYIQDQTKEISALQE